MNEIITGIKEEFPRFILHYFKVLTSPRTYPLTLAKKQKQEKGIASAITYFILCRTLATVFIAPMYGLTESWGWANLCYSIVFDCLILVLSAAALRLSWRPLNGSTTFPVYLIMMSYIFGTVLAIFHFISLISLSILNRYEPAYYRYVVDQYYLKKNVAEPFSDLLGHPAVIVYTLGGLFMIIFSLSWFFIAWAGFRKANGKRRGQGLIAAFIFTAIMSVVMFLGNTIAILFFGH